MYVDLVILDKLGYLPFSRSGGALLFHLLSKLNERTSVIARNLSFTEWAGIFNDAKMTTELLVPINFKQINQPRKSKTYPYRRSCITRINRGSVLDENPGPSLG